MQVDMHYCATAVLARAAGFDEDDALVVGFAAQYVDDALDGRDILVGGRPFSPLSTANDLGRYLKSQDPQVWHKVYIPFHFLPPDPAQGPAGDFLTQPRGRLVEGLLADVARDQPLGQPHDRLYGLCRLGVALHTVADTWSHQGFSGRWHDENDVREVRVLDQPDDLVRALKRAWSEWAGAVNALLPMKVAHFQAGFLPDYPFLEWRAVFAGADGEMGREMRLNNREQYLLACRFLHDTLLAWPKGRPAGVVPWPRIEPEIQACLACNEVGRQARCDRWRQAFAHLFPDHGGLPAYDKHQWEVQALGEKLRQTPFSDLAESLGSRPSYPGAPDFQSSAWVQFHGAALAQRRWVGQQVKV